MPASVWRGLLMAALPFLCLLSRAHSYADSDVPGMSDLSGLSSIVLVDRLAGGHLVDAALAAPPATHTEARVLSWVRLAFEALSSLHAHGIPAGPATPWSIRLARADDACGLVAELGWSRPSSTAVARGASSGAAASLPTLGERERASFMPPASSQAPTTAAPHAAPVPWAQVMADADLVYSMGATLHTLLLGEPPSEQSVSALSSFREAAALGRDALDGDDATEALFPHGAPSRRGEEQQQAQHAQLSAVEMTPRTARARGLDAEVAAAGSMPPIGTAELSVLSPGVLHLLLVALKPGPEARRRPQVRALRFFGCCPALPGDCAKVARVCVMSRCGSQRVARVLISAAHRVPPRGMHVIPLLPQDILDLPCWEPSPPSAPRTPLFAAHQRLAWYRASAVSRAFEADLDSALRRTGGQELVDLQAQSQY